MPSTSLAVEELEKAVSEFIVNTCIFHPRPNWYKFIGLRELFTETEDILGNNVTHRCVKTLTGSASEFYIDTMLPCVGDVDIMRYSSNRLAVPEVRRWTRHVVRLPVEFETNDEIELYELSDTHFAGYVLIQLIGKLIKKCKNGEYKFAQATDKYEYTKIKRLSGATIHGPANFTPDANAVTGEMAGRTFKTVVPRDLVNCIRCLEWPPQAAEWSTRMRRYGWPDAATVQRIVDNGCDLVNTTHRQCKHSEWFTERMRRLSFSRAETVLMSSLTPIQQVAYHVLRYVVKKMDLIESTDQHPQPSRCGIISNYHLKTLMLWSSELHPPQWWTSRSLVRITTELLHDLAGLLRSGECKQYFIARCNLLDHLQDFESSDASFVVATLESQTEATLSNWLIQNYARQCAELCKRRIGDLMNAADTTEKLIEALSAVVNWKKGSSEHSLRQLFGMMSAIERAIRLSRLAPVRVYQQIVVMLRDQIDGRLVDYFIGLTFLHFTELMEAAQDNLTLIVQVVHEFMKFSAAASSVGLPAERWPRSTNKPFKMAIEILMSPRSAEVNTDSLLKVELTKALFHVSVGNTDHAHQDNGDCVTLNYLASLYRSTRQYQTAIDQLLLATASCSPPGCSHVIESHLLPADDDIHALSGLIVLYQHVKQPDLPEVKSPPETELVSAVRFNSELFSFYCIFECLGRTKERHTSFSGDLLTRYRSAIRRSKSLVIGDVLLIYAAAADISSNVQHQPRHSTSNRTPAGRSRSGSSSAFNMTRLRCLLSKSAVERLTAVRHVMSRDYGWRRAVVTSDYEAMYAYKCGEYERCLHLCLEYANRMSTDLIFRSLGVKRSIRLPSSDLLLLMDDGFLSLVGLCSLGRAHEGEYVSQLTLFYYLLVRCKLAMKHARKSFIAILRNMKDVLHCSLFESVTDRLLFTYTFRLEVRRVLSVISST